MSETKYEELLKQAEKLYEQQDYEEAIPYYQKILETNPHDTKELYNVGENYFELHDYKNAAKLYQKILDTYSQDCFAEAGKMYVYFETNDYDQELQIDKDSQPYDAYALDKLMSIGEMYSQEHDCQEALNIYESILMYTEQDGRYASFYQASLHKAANLYYSLEQFQKAFDAYMKILTKFSQPDERDQIYEKIQTIYYHTIAKQEIEKQTRVLREEKEKEQLIVAAQKKMLSFLTHSLMNIIAGSKGTAARVLNNARNALGARYQELSVYKILNDLAGLDIVFTLIANMIRTYRLYIRDSEHVLQSWREDRGGDVTLTFLFALVFRQTLARILFDELHQSQLDMLLTLQTTSSMEEVQESFLTEILTLKLTPHNDEAVFIWLKTYFPVISLHIRAPNIFLNFTGIRFNLLFACISEIVYNALKYQDGSKPIEILWKKQERAFIVSCQNTFSASSTARTGAQKGLSFIKGLTEMISGLHFAEEVQDAVFTVELSIEETLLEGGRES